MKTDQQDKSIANAKEVQDYLTLLDAARTKEKDWRKESKEVIAVYESTSAKRTPYNILYSNTALLAPALYSQPPKPVVKRRHRGENLLAKLSADIVQELLKYLLDSNDPNYTSMDESFASAVLETLVPGRGQSRVKYESYISEESEVEYETVCLKEVPWDRFLHGYAKKWADVPWVSYEHFLSHTELVELLGKEDANKVPLTASSEALKSEKDTQELKGEMEDLGHIYEVWDRVREQVVFICPDYTEEILKRVDDEYKLTGFFPSPRPLNFYAKVSGLTPQSIYQTYREQAEELNEITVRIEKITDALKVRGFYDGSVEGLAKLMDASDNTLIAAQNVEKLEGKNLDALIWLMPLSELVGVLNQLYLNRKEVKAVIFEITGLSDLLRGSTMASETASAQELKSQWGTLRLKGMQKEVARFVRDSLRLVAELAVSSLSQETIKGMTGLKYPTEEDKQKAQKLMKDFQVQMQQAQDAGQQMPPEPPPQIAQLEEILKMPSWEQLLGLLENDLQRNYLIDIETNSTIAIEASEEQQEVADFLNAFSQFLNGIGPLIQEGIMPFEVSKEIMIAVTRKYRFGEEIEEQLKKMQAPQPPQGPDPKELQAQMQQIDQKGQEVEQQTKKAEEQLKGQAEQMQQKLRQEERKIQDAAHDLLLERKDFELDKKLAEKELAFNSKLQSADCDLKSSVDKASLGLAERVAKEDLGRQSEDLKEKSNVHQLREKEHTQNVEVQEKEVGAKLEAVAQELVQRIIAAATVEKRAVKQKDGSYISETVGEVPELEIKESGASGDSAIDKSLASMKSLIAEGFKQAASVERRVKKDKEGNWVTETKLRGAGNE